MKIRVNPWPNLTGALGAGAIVIAFCLLLLWRDPLLFWNDDYELSILPVFADVARSWSEGNWPLLSPYSWVCSNLAGEFQYGTFSAFVNAAVILIWKLPVTFSQQAAALSMCHLFVLGAGGYLLARGRNVDAPLSVMVALVCAANGWIICWGATDWFGALGAFTWLPWAWWALDRALDRHRSRWRFLWPAPFVYLLVTGGFPYTVLMLGLLTGWLALQSLGRTRALSCLWPLALGSALGLGLAAPAWLALLDYVHGSVRAANNSSEHFQWLVPLIALPGFVLPGWTTNWTDFSTRLMPHTATELACGLVAPVALLLGLTRYGRLLVRRIGWELGLLLAVLILSMLPSANVFRWSFRWLPFLHVILALCAAKSLQLLTANGGPGVQKWFLRPGVTAVGLVVIGAAAMFLAGAAGPYGWRLTAVMFGLALAWAAADFLPARFAFLRSWTPAGITFAALLATYLCIPPNCGVPRYNLSQRLVDPAPLDPNRLYLSIYPQPEHAYRVEKNAGPLGEVVRLGSISMWGGVRFVNGYSPIRPAGVAREYNFGIHGEIDFPAAKRLVTTEAGPDGEMARLGIDGLILVTEMKLPPPPADEWERIFSSAEGTVYHRRGDPLEHVRSVSGLGGREGEWFAPAEVTLLEDSRNRVVADVEVESGGYPALLTIARPFFRGYKATLNGDPLTVSSDRGLIPVVEIPPGSSGRFELIYRPWWLVCGGVMSAASVLVIFGSITVALARSRASPRAYIPTRD